MERRRTAYGLACLVCPVVALLLSCTVLVSEDPIQCHSDGDCAARGPDFANTVCGPTGLCQPRPGPPPECLSNADCAAKGPGQICSSIHARCAPLASDECSVVYGDPMTEGTVLFGLLSEIGPDDTLYVRQEQHATAAKLAFAEFFEKAGARLPGGRSAALIACSEQRPRSASAHLANLGVRAVIGPASEARQKAVVETLVPARVPSFSPWINGSPARVVPDSAGFAWLANFERPDVVAPLNALLAEQETRLKQSRLLPSVRVAVILNTQPASLFNPFAEYGELMDQRLRYNGKSAVENERDATCGNCYKRFETTQAAAPAVDARATEILNFAPHFIIPFTDLDWGSQLLPRLEQRYAALPSSSRPIYLHPFLQFEDAGYAALPIDLVETRRRITGVRPLRDNSFEVFQNKFRETFRPPTAPTKLGPQPYPGAGRAFETALLLLFATHAALVENPDAKPEDVVRALDVVTDSASPLKITLNDIAAGVQRLNAREHINLDGLFTFFDFDRKTSTAPATWTTWCVNNRGQYVSGTRVYKDGSFGPPAFCD